MTALFYAAAAGVLAAAVLRGWRKGTAERKQYTVEQEGDRAHEVISFSPQQTRTMVANRARSISEYDELQGFAAIDFLREANKRT